MAFVEQGAKQPVLGHFLAEVDLSNKRIIASSSTLKEQHDTNVQGLFATHTPDYLSKRSIANDSALQLASSSVIPHWLSTNQVQNISIDTTLKRGSTGNAVMSTTMPRFSEVHEKVGAFCALPSPNLGIGSEGRNNSSIGIGSMDSLANSRHLFQQHVPAQLPQPLSLMPSLSLKRDGQKEEPNLSKENALSFLLHKQEKQPAKGCLTDLPILSLGLSGRQLSHERTEVSSWVSKFPFQITSNFEQAERGQSIQHRENLAHNLLANSKSECRIQSACKKVVDVSSHFMGSKGQIDDCQSLVRHIVSSTGAANDVLLKKTSLANAPSDSQWSLSATISGSNVPSLKRDWSATFMQGVKHSQLLPDFFAQQKATVAANKANRSHFDNSEDTEMSMKVAFSQKSLASRANGEDARFNLPSLDGGIHSNKFRISSIDHMSIKQQEMNDGGETFMTRPLSSVQSLHDSLKLADVPRIKLETSIEDCRAFEHAKFASRKSTDGVITEVSLSADHAVRQPLSITAGVGGMAGNSKAAELMLFRDVVSTGLSTIASAGLPSISPLKYSSNFEGLKEEKFPANTYAPFDRDWGDFLAAPSFGQNAEIEGKCMLPFQQRFEQLQKFLKKCDGSDDEYCLRALCSLSGTERSNQSAELESRARRLSLEEGKEMKRAKLLKVLEEMPEGTCMNPCAGPMAPWLSASRAAQVMKEA